MQATRIMLSLNTLTCVGFGVAFLILAPTIGRFLGEVPPLWLRVIGAGLVLHGVHLLIVSLGKTVSRMHIYYFSAGDLLWFLASLLVIVATELITTTGGVMTTLAVGLMVASIGLTQIWTFAEATGSGRNGEDAQEPSDWYLPAHHSRWKAIGVSWLGMKTWVKLWLFALNGAFLCAFFFWPSPLAKIIVGAFVASGSLLLATMIDQRGLTRFLGLAHLIPWIPLLIYLLLRLSSDRVGAQITVEADPALFSYVSLLTGMVTICLLFDIYDLHKWFSGANGRLGSPSETRLKSSSTSMGSQT